MWRGLDTNFSMSTRPSPNDALASRWAPFERRIEIGMAVDAPHAFAAAAGDRLDQDRVPDLIGFLLEEFWLLHLPVIAGHDRNTGLLHDGLGAVLQTHGADRLDRRSDKGNAGIDDRPAQTPHFPTESHNQDEYSPHGSLWRMR